MEWHRLQNLLFHRGSEPILVIYGSRGAECRDADVEAPLNTSTNGIGKKGHRSELFSASRVDARTWKNEGISRAATRYSRSHKGLGVDFRTRSEGDRFAWYRGMVQHRWENIFQ